MWARICLDRNGHEPLRPARTHARTRQWPALGICCTALRAMGYLPELALS